MLRHLGTAVRVTIVSIVLLGLIYPLAMTGLAQALFPRQANGSLVVVNGKVVGSSIIGQLWSKPQYFQGRPSAAGKGYDPTATGGDELRADVEEAHRFDAQDDRAAGEGESGRRRAAADGPRDLERKRHRPGHQPAVGILGVAPRGEGAPHERRRGRRVNRETRCGQDVRLLGRATRERARAEPRARQPQASVATPREARPRLVRPAAAE